MAGGLSSSYFNSSRRRHDHDDTIEYRGDQRAHLPSDMVFNDLPRESKRANLAASGVIFSHNFAP